MSTRAAEIAGISGVDAGAIPYPTQHAMLICLSGTAGTVKTRLAHGLEYAFRRDGIQVQYQWLSGGNSTFAEIMVRLCRFRPGPGSHLWRSPGPESGFQFGARRAFWYLLVAIDLLQFCIFRVRLPLLLGKVVICDGYTFDTFTDTASLYERDPSSPRMNLFERLFHFLYPEPDLHYLLVGSLEEAEHPTGGQNFSDEANLHVKSRLYLTRYRDCARFLVKRADEDFEPLERDIIRESIKKYWLMARPNDGGGNP